MLSDISAAYNHFENSAAKGEIAQDEQFLHLPQCFQFVSVIIPSFIEIFQHAFKVVCRKFAVCGKWLNTLPRSLVDNDRTRFVNTTNSSWTKNEHLTLI